MSGTLISRDVTGNNSMSKTVVKDEFIGPSQAFMIAFFCKNSQWLKDIFFRNKILI